MRHVSGLQNVQDVDPACLDIHLHWKLASRCPWEQTSQLWVSIFFNSNRRALRRWTDVSSDRAMTIQIVRRSESRSKWRIISCLVIFLFLEREGRPYWKENPGMQETKSIRKPEADVGKLFIQTIPSHAIRKEIESLAIGSKTYIRRRSTAKEGKLFSLKLLQEGFSN
jgi:hypothetical protein